VHRGRGRARRFARGVVDGDRDADRAAAFAAQRLADERREPAFQDALAPFIGDGEQRRVGDQCERLAALDPLLVLRLDALLALPEELLQHSWPHCGKIGRYVSHKARSLAGPTNVWFSGRDGSGWVRTGRQEEKEPGFNHGSQADPRGSSCCPQPVHSAGCGRAGLTGWRGRAYRGQVELSMAAAACLRWAKITICDREAVH
jgi:hypothetical protein